MEKAWKGGEAHVYELTMFFLVGFPFCQEARRLIERVLEETPEYKAVKINYIDERIEKELTDRYDYRYVPAFYANEKKLHEGAVDIKKVRKVFESAYSESNGI